MDKDVLNDIIDDINNNDNKDKNVIDVEATVKESVVSKVDKVKEDNVNDVVKTNEDKTNEVKMASNDLKVTDGVVRDTKVKDESVVRTRIGTNSGRSTKKKENKNNGGNNTTIVLLVSILLSFVCGMLGAYLISQTVSVEQVVKNITTSELVENSISSSVDKVYGSTVVVVAYSKGQQISTGTGFIYKQDSKNAYIMTNNHVIDGADEVEIEFNDSSDRVEAKILGGETYSDIAVLTTAASDSYVPVEIGENAGLKLGDTIFTVGSPMGVEYKGTVTKGILSGKERMIEVSDYYMKVIQIDAAVNPGNSGGPLCDVSGKVIGIISLKIVQDEVEGMGFAIPIEDALEYAELIEEGGEITRPYIGISMVDLTQEYYLWQNRIDIPEDVEEGIAVVEVEKGSPADKAGLKKGDIIVKLGDGDTGSLAEFRYELYKYDVGDKVVVTFYRDDKLETLTITLGKNENE